MPLIKSLQKIVNDIKRMIEDIVEDFKYDPGKLATTDKFIDKQIADEESNTEFLDIHKDNTIHEIKAIDKASNPTAIEKQKKEVEDFKLEKTGKIANAKDKEAEIEISKKV